MTSEVIDAVAAEGASDCVAKFADLGLQTLRGRETSVKLYGIPRTTAPSAY